jgi:hypothetical protein
MVLLMTAARRFCASLGDTASLGVGEAFRLSPQPPVAASINEAAAQTAIRATCLLPACVTPTAITCLPSQRARRCGSIRPAAGKGKGKVPVFRTGVSGSSKTPSRTKGRSMALCMIERMEGVGTQSSLTGFPVLGCLARRPPSKVRHAEIRVLAGGKPVLHSCVADIPPHLSLYCLDECIHFGGLASASSSTCPSGRFLTYPVTANRSATRQAVYRKPTPCTAPPNCTIRRIFRLLSAWPLSLMPAKTVNGQRSTVNWYRVRDSLDRALCRVP